VTSEGKCVCNDGFYLVPAGQPNAGECKPCHNTCQTCSGAADTNCVTCDLTHYTKTADNKCTCTTNVSQLQTDGTCKPLPTSTHCKYWEFEVDTTSHKCAACNKSCLTCKGAKETDCERCDTGEHFVLVSGKCVCVAGWFKVQDRCEKCHPSCATCSGPEREQCLTCPANIA
jgi:proprotein convertase subtilisin/kexin type 5